MDNIKLDAKEKLLEHLRKHLGAAAGQLLDNYTMFSPLKQNSEEEQ